MLRRLLGSAAVAAAMVLAAGAASAQDWPAKGPIKFLNGFPPGGSADLLARYVAEQLSTALGQQVVVDTRTGSGGMVAGQAAASAPPDGYTLLQVTMGMMSISPALLEKLPVDVDKQLTPVVNVAGLYNILVVDPKTPFKTVKDIIDYGKANPDKLTYASVGNGSSQHLSAELFKSMTGIEMLQVPYRGGAPAITDMIGGRVHMMFGNMPEFLPHIQAGALRAVGFGTIPGSPTLPDVPTIDKTVPGYRIDNWFGMAVPAGTPQPIVDRLNAEVNKMVKSKETEDKLGPMGFKLLGGTQAEFLQQIMADRQKWAKVIKDQNIKPD